MRRAMLPMLLVAALLAPPVAPALATRSRPNEAPDVIPLGTVVREGHLVEGFAFVHERATVSRSAPSKEDPYTFLARGARWRTVEPFVIAATNEDGVRERLVRDALAEGVAAWEAPVTTDIIGAGSLTDAPVGADWNAPDGINEVCFSSSDLGPRIVAITIVWGVFSGPTAGRELLEWDLVFNDALPEKWGTGAPGEWDVQNIATHELGHAVGLGDLYARTATQQTMYGYASPGETQKRTLESGDIAGVRALYQ